MDQAVRLDADPGQTRVQRVDVAPIKGVKRTPQGGLRIDASLTRTGILVYRDDSGREVREYRPPEEVFHADSMADLAGAPVTDLHPGALVTPKTFRSVAVGHVADGTVKQDGSQVSAELVIQDATLVAAIEARSRTQVSAGYTVKIDATPGKTPAGEPYDQVQREIRYNHVAIVPRGRAGADVALRLDAAGNEVPIPERDLSPQRVPMRMIKIDGIDYPLTTDAEIQAALQAHARSMLRLDGEIAAARKASDTAQGRADAAEAQVKDLTAKLATAADPARLDAAIAARFDLVASARKVLGAEWRADALPATATTAARPALTDRQIMEAAIAKAQPAIKLDGASDDYLRGVFSGLTIKADATQAADPSGLGALRRATAPAQIVPPVGSETDPVAAARARMDAANKAAASAPLAYSKDAPQAAE